MTISLPEEIVYYYQSPEKKDRLLCWIPRNELERLVKESKNLINKQILDDFPHGLDIEVNDVDLKYYEEKYNLKLGINLTDVREAFDFVQKQTKESGIESSNFVNFSMLNEIAETKKKMFNTVEKEDKKKGNVDTFNFPGKFLSEKGKEFKISEKEIKDLFKVKFSDGDKNPLTIFSSLQKRLKKG
jgi:hypothetical protein